jgi:HK97 family phage portal protein
MNLPRWLQRKSNPVSKAIVYYLGGVNAIWTPHDYAALCREGFNTQATVYSAITLIAAAAARVPWLLYQKPRGQGGSPTEVTDHPLLTMLGRPNGEQGSKAYREAVFAYLLLSGNSYEAPVGPDQGPPTEMWCLRPDRMKIIPGGGQRIGGYVYAKDSPAERRFELDRQGRHTVLHHKLFSAVDDWYGHSPIAVAAKAIDASNSALAWNVSLLQNHARPSGALVAKGVLDDPSYQRLKTELQSTYQGAMNAGAPLVLDGDLDWKALSISPSEMDWLQGLQQVDRVIARVFHVAPELLGDAAGKTYANMAEAKRALYEDVVVPLLEHVGEDWNNHLVPRWGNDLLYLAPNLDAIAALRESQDALYTRTEAAHSLSLNEKRQALGFSPIDGFDVITLANGMVLILDEDARASTGKLTVRTVMTPAALLPLDEDPPELPEEVEEEEEEDDDKVTRLPARAS